MNKRPDFSDLLAAGMFLCFGLTAGMAAAAQGLHPYYQTHRAALNAPYPYAYGYLNHVLLPLVIRFWLVSCLLAVVAVILLVIYGVCRRRQTSEETRRNRWAADLCGCTFPLSIWLFLDVVITAGGLLV